MEPSTFIDGKPFSGLVTDLLFFVASMEPSTFIDGKFKDGFFTSVLMFGFNGAVFFRRRKSATCHPWR